MRPMRNRRDLGFERYSRRHCWSQDLYGDGCGCGFSGYKTDVQWLWADDELTPHLTTALRRQCGGDIAGACLNFDSPDFSANLNTRALENVPVNNLRWSSLALITPGVVSDSNGFGLVSIRGSARSEQRADRRRGRQPGLLRGGTRRTREAYSTHPRQSASST